MLIGVQALQTTQGALDATSNNIANADTPGYTREVPQFAENPETVMGDFVDGGGVSLTGLQSVRDELLNLQIQQQTSAQYGADAQVSNLQQVQSYFTTSGNDVASAFSSFSSSLDQLSASPGASGALQGVLTSGQNLARSFNTAANGLTSIQSATNTQVTQTVSQINTLSQQIAQLNGQIYQLNAAGQDGGTVQDQRDEAVQQLSQLAGISITQSSSGEVVTTANGSPLVMGNQSFSLQTVTGSDGMQHVLDANGTDITSTIQGGTLGGTIAVRDQIIPGYLTQLNTLASQFATAFNNAQTEGYTSTGQAGQAFFNIPSGTSGAAEGMSVAITDPSQIASSSDGSAGSNGNVVNLSAALTNDLPSGVTPTQAYSSLVFDVGNDESNANTQSTAIGQSLLQLTNQQSSVSGVSIDEETTNLIRFQTAYEAAARVVSTIQALDTVTLDMGSTQSY